MKVYMLQVIYGGGYDGSEVFGIFSNEEKAIEFYNNRPEHMKDTPLCRTYAEAIAHIDYYYLTEMELDPKA